MKTKAEILALLGESLTLPAILWIFSVTLILRDRETPVPGVTVVYGFVFLALLIFLLVLRKERSIVFLAVLSGILFAAGIAGLIVLYTGSIGFGYILSSALISGGSVFGTLYYCLAKQTLSGHLVTVDVSVMALIWMFLNLQTLNVTVFSLILLVAVLILDMAGAAALRMSEEGMSEGAGKAFVLAALCACAAAGLIFALSQVFLRTGNITQTIVNGVTAFFSWIWRGIEAFFKWLSQFFTAPETEEVLLPEMQGGINAEEILIEENRIDPAVIGAVFAAIVIIIVVIVIYKMRRSRVRLKTASAGTVRVRKTARKRGRLKEKWAAFLKRLRFRANAFIYRNTPPGVLICLENNARKKKEARREGESIRAFIMRAAADEEFEELALDLERKYYGGGEYTLSKSRCRELRKKIS